MVKRITIDEIFTSLNPTMQYSIEKHLEFHYIETLNKKLHLNIYREMVDFNLDLYNVYKKTDELYKAKLGALQDTTIQMYRILTEKNLIKEEYNL